MSPEHLQQPFPADGFGDEPGAPKLKCYSFFIQAGIGRLGDKLYLWFELPVGSILKTP